ncbi:MAG: NHL repeat-containing protein [Planctomycetota bacterium]
MKYGRRDSSSKSTVKWLVVAGIALAGCNGSGTANSISGVNNTTGPQMTSVRYIDIDADGIDADDIVVISFDRVVTITSNTVSAFQFASSLDTFGTDALMTQSVPNSTSVEVTLGSAPDFSITSSRINIRSSLTLNIRDTSGVPARVLTNNLSLTDFSAMAPTIIRAVYVDSDLSGSVNVGDEVLCEFNKPISVPLGATVADNFALSVTSDSFGASPSLRAFRNEEPNRGAVITLGAGAVLTVTGTFDSTIISAGSPSNIRTGPVGTVSITDTSSGGVLIANDIDVDLALNPSTLFRTGAAGSLFPGNVDSSAPDVSAHGFFRSAGVSHYDGTLVIGGNSFSIDVLFVADTDNNRVLIFEDKPTGSNADATAVLGQPDLYSNLPNQSDETDPAPAGDTLWGPQDVHFSAASNQLFVSDTLNNRVLVYSDVFDGTTGMYNLADGQAADLVVGQTGFSGGDPNQGGSLPTSRTLSAPGGLHARGGQLAVADAGNHRVLIWSSLPTTNNEAASTVLGQADFITGIANRGGAVAANTLNEPADVFLDPGMRVFGVTNGAILIADTGNNRVLLFSSASPTTGSAAQVALGQGALTTATAGTTLATLDGPTGVTALDGAGGATTGRIWVADRNNHRVMAYTFNPDTASGSGTSEPQTGMAAADALGQALDTDSGENRGSATVTAAANSYAFPTRLNVSEESESNLLVADRDNDRVLDFSTLPVADATIPVIVHGQSSFTTSQAKGHLLNHPTAIATTAGKLIVTDSLNHRVVIYNTVPASGSPTPDVVLGQANINVTLANQGLGAPTAATLNEPEGVATDGTRLVVADTGNNRVLVYSAIPTTDGFGAGLGELQAVLGQPNATSSLANNGGLSAARMSGPTAVVISGVQLIVCDRENHRVLIFDDVTAVATGDSADIVIGQNDFVSNSPNQGDAVRATTLNEPSGVAVVGGVLYVADEANNRVLGYLTVPTSNGRPANFALGQTSLTAAVAGTTSRLMRGPTAIGSDGESLVVADTGNHRVLFYADVPLSTGVVATAALGQPSTSVGLPNQGGDIPNTNSLNHPRGLFSDGLDVWVADQMNSRLVRFR